MATARKASRTIWAMEPMEKILTFAGGAGGQGTIYRVSKGGGQTVLYAFTGNDGGGSLSRLVGQDCVPIHTLV
jgi:uncharacterized repeat protein (TIGR03803 family)